jgi:hypothetical protein
MIYLLSSYRAIKTAYPPRYSQSQRHNAFYVTNRSGTQSLKRRRSRIFRVNAHDEMIHLIWSYVLAAGGGNAISLPYRHFPNSSWPTEAEDLGHF